MTEDLNNPTPETATKLQKLKEKLGLAPASSEELANPDFVATEEVPAEAPPEQEATRMLTGKDVDWSDFDLDPNLAHLYPKAQFVPMLEGPKWVALLDVFEFETAEINVSKAGRKAGKKSLGDLTTERVNGSDQWRIATVFASGPGFGAVMFTRTVQIVLPDPRQLRTEAELPAAPTDPELQAAEDAALGWIEEQGVKVESEDPIIEELESLTNADIAAAKAAAQPRLFSPLGQYTDGAAADSALMVEAPSTEQVMGAALNQPTERVPLGFGPNAVDGQGTILDTTYEVPAVQAKEAAQEAMDALRGPDFETEEGKAILDAAQPLAQMELPLDGEQK